MTASQKNGFEQFKRNNDGSKLGVYRKGVAPDDEGQGGLCRRIRRCAGVHQTKHVREKKC
jgi:hypothetical protein